MKMFLFAIVAAAFVSTTSAHAFESVPSFPDFSMTESYEISVVTKDADVKAYAKKLGASSFKVVKAKAKEVYTVVTNNGYKFEAQVVYYNWPGVDEVIVYANARK